MIIDRKMGSKGMLSGSVLLPSPSRELTIEDIYRWGRPEKGLTDEVNDWRSDNWRQNVSRRGLPELKFALKHHIPSHYGALFVAKAVPDKPLEHLGLASLRVVTNNGVAFIVNCFVGTTTITNMKYHGIGVGTTAEAAADSILVTELTTQYNPDNVRATGTTVAFAANIYQTVATNNVDSAVAITEHGVFGQAAVGASSTVNALFDRSVFAAVNLASGDGIQTDYRGTFTSGG